jgi:branched-chain amino acid transport system ATP-binding protein
MCLAARPRLLLLDEPLAGLGLADVPRITELLQRLKARYAVLLVEHNMRVVMGISDRITVMFQGNVIAEGAPAAIRENAQVRRVYLGSQS